MEAEESSSINSENVRIAGLESQILNSQEIIVRLNRELDSALLRITTLENVCSENQNDLHEKRSRIQQLNDEMIEQEESNDRLIQELQEKDERLQSLNDLIIQLKQHIKNGEEKQIDSNNIEHQVSEDTSSITSDLQFQIKFDQELRQLIFDELNNNDNLLDLSPQTIIGQYHDNERRKFYDLLQESLTTEDISHLIDSDDILFELLTHLNSLSRLKETLSRDSKELQHIRSLLHLTNDDNNDEIIKDLINKRECIEYLRQKIDSSSDLTDFDLIKNVLHNYFNFQQQQIDLKEYLHINNTNDNDRNYLPILIERCNEANHIRIELNERIANYEQIKNQLNDSINETLERQNEIDNIVATFYNQSIDHDTSEVSQLNRIRTILQSNIDFQHAIFSEILVTSTDDALQRLHEYKLLNENNQISIEKDSIPNQQLTIDELTKEIQELKEDINERKIQLKEITNLLKLDNNDNEEIQYNLIYSFLRSLINFHQTLSNKLSVTDNNELILQRIDDYQLIINELNSDKSNWSNETTTELITKLETMKHAENTIEHLQKQLDQTIHNENQLQLNIEQITDKFIPITDNNQDSNLTRIHQLLESLTNSNDNILQYQEKQNAESQTTDNNDEFYTQIKELMNNEENNPEKIIDKIRELSQLPSPTKIHMLFSNYEKLRNLFNVDDDDSLIETAMNLNENFLQLKQEYEILIKKEDIMNKSIGRLMDKVGLSSDSSSRTQIDEICAIFDTFCFEYSQLISSDIKIINLMELFKNIPLVIEENNQFKELIKQIDYDQSSEHLNYTLKLENYLTKVKNLCQLISHDNINIDQTLITYQEKIQHDRDIIEKISTFKQKLLTHLSIDNEEQIFDRLNEINQINTKLQNIDDSANTLNITITDQHKKIREHEDTIEKLRSQRERMLTKMKEMKINNETLANQLKQINQSLDEQYRKEIDYKNRIEELEQQKRSINNQIQVTLDECKTQQDLQETMKLEIKSIQNMMYKKKLYESRCRQIINEKNQLEKNRKELIEQKQIVEDDNKRLQTILQTIKDTFENVDDINSIVDIILKMQEDHQILNHRYEQMDRENEKLLIDIDQQQSIINEYNQTKNELEKCLFNNEQQIKNFEKEIQNKNELYEQLQDEYRLYKEDNENNKHSQVVIIDTEQSEPVVQSHYQAPIQQTTESNNWTTINIEDKEIPLTTTNKHSIIDTSAALFNLFGELKSKLGITLTHRPRSSSVFFLYLCAVHLLTVYLLFIRHC
ncbi:unnamed protein product [Adineta steineri]|uniref:Uncharacterized protein n=1 Tax=Adineta steineri TaxID=433720 RepID=A0A814PAU1_9BILA|nr:unnamed protein product [Adineta steineri]CAF1313460.1 unnamed protein product [Adineta steineri]